jgi:hypothetical protein
VKLVALLKFYLILANITILHDQPYLAFRLLVLQTNESVVGCDRYFYPSTLGFSQLLMLTQPLKPDECDLKLTF